MPPMRPVLMATKYAVSCGHYLAAEAANRILEDGGNAIDAGVAAGMALGVLHTDLVNFAGVAPMLIRLGDTGEIINIDGLGTWPQAATAEFFVREYGGQIPLGLLRTVVPAAPAAWLTALSRYGTRSFAEVARFAIDYAGNGFPVFDRLAGFIADHEAGYRRWPENSRIYLPIGRLPKPGDVFVQEDLAKTIRYMADCEAAAMAKPGADRASGIQAAYDAFYRGDIAKTICDYHAANGGFMTMADMDGYRVRFEKPLVVPFAGAEIHCCGAWCQGLSLAQTFAMLGDVGICDFGHNSAAGIHRLTEILKLVFADREACVGDPEFVDVPVDTLLSNAYVAKRLAMIDAHKAWPEMPPAGVDGPGSPGRGDAGLDTFVDPHDTRPLERGSIDADTTYVAVMDARGNVFSATPSDTSCESPVIPGTGLVPSSRGSQSRGDPAHPASVAPGKRPRLTPNPALAMKDGQPYMAFGTPGGDVQIQAMVQVYLNIVGFGMDVQSAVEAPRFASYSFPSSFAPNEDNPGLLMVEDRIDASTRAALGDLGHRVETWPATSWKAGAVCVVLRDPETGVLHAGADPRRASYALGR
ncbi:MAG: gamma-glutamyltransferase [Verrucomicrobia bacterium]|nr:gamma-glutamyltransferase [Verrucomicrobiota bacterium]